MVRSSCLCGEIAWEVEGELEHLCHCHCSMCRKSHGVGYATWAMAPAAGFHLLQGEELVARYESSPGLFRRFCSRCGSKAPGEPAREVVFLPAGNADGDPGGRPEFHMFAGSRAPWDEIHDELPQYEAYPPGWPAPEIQPSAPSARRREGATRGSCLCGGAAFEIVGEPRGIVLCHCSRCRKGRSAAHCANLFYRDAELCWIRGSELRRHFKLPDAQRFTQTFCRVCGSLLPHDPTPGQLRAVPAGCLDDEPGVGCVFHIFVGSNAPWVEIADDLPRFDEGVSSSR